MRCLWATTIAFGAFWVGLARGQLPAQEEQFISSLISDYRALNIAERYLASQVEATSGLTRGSYEWYLLADIPRVRGELEVYVKALQELAKRYPKHPRAGRSRLDFQKSQMDRLALLRDEALIESDIARRTTLFDQLVEEFTKTVRPGFEALIQDLNESVEQAGTDDFGQPKNKDLALLRNEAEYVWILAMYRFAQFLDQPRFQKLGEKTLREALQAATSFVDDRADFYVLRYLAQLQKGLCLAELGRFEEAASALELLTTITPPVAPQAWTDELILKICEIRLQAYVHTIRCYTRARQFQAAAALIDRLFHGQRPPFNLTELGPKEARLRPHWVEAQLEAGVALAGVGRPKEAAEKIHGIITTYLPRTRDDEAQRYVRKARSALARMVDVAGPVFPPTTILEAGKGYKHELNWEGARRVFQIGLGAVRKPDDRVRYYPRLLSQVAECSHLAGHLRDALFSSLTALRHFAPSCPTELNQRLANYAMAAADQLKETETSAAFQRYYDEAADFFLRYGDPTQRFILIMIEATDLKNARKLAEARTRFRQVPSIYEKKGTSHDFEHYWRARAEAADCLYQIYLAGKKTNADQRRQVLQELEEILAKATAAQPPQLDGMAAAAYYLSELYREPNMKNRAKALDVLALFENELASVDVYRDSALYNYAVVLAELERHEEALDTFKALRTAFPESVEWARAAGDLFAFYAQRGEAARAAPYAAAYLEHPIIKGSSVDEDFLFEIGLVLADSGRAPFLPQARAIFETFATDTDRDKRVRAGTGLVKIYLAEQRYEEAVTLGTKLLAEARPDEQWVRDLYRDMKKAYQALMQTARKGGDTKQALDYLSKAERCMREVVKRVWAERSAVREGIILGTATPEDYRSITIVVYRDYLELLLIWTKQRRYSRVNGTIGLLFKDGCDFLPSDLTRRYEKLYGYVRKKLKLPPEKLRISKDPTAVSA